eukprot:g17735.t1
MSAVMAADAVLERKVQHRPFLIAVSGGTASGKVGRRADRGDCSLGFEWDCVSSGFVNPDFRKHPHGEQEQQCAGAVPASGARVRRRRSTDAGREGA